MRELIWYFLSIGGLVVAVLAATFWLRSRPHSAQARRFLSLIVIAYAVLTIYGIGEGVGRLLDRNINPLAAVTSRLDERPSWCSARAGSRRAIGRAALIPSSVTLLCARGGPGVPPGRRMGHQSGAAPSRRSDEARASPCATQC